MTRRVRPPRPRPGRSGHPRIAEIGTAALRRFRANLTPDKMCGAKARSTGEPCRQIPAKGRKRCKFHGGATPRGDGGDGWHTPAFPAGLPVDSPHSARMKATKRRQQRARVAKMTPEERAGHAEWHRAHKPGSKSARAQGRQNRDARRWLASLGQDTAAAPTPEIAELREARAKLSAEIARLEAEGTETPTPGVDEPTGGLFD